MSVGHKCDGGSVPGDDRSADSEAPSPDVGDTQAAARVVWTETQKEDVAVSSWPSTEAGRALVVHT